MYSIEEMTDDEWRLELFNHRVNRLDRCNLAKLIENANFTLDYERMMNREWISVNSITEDDVDAFALNIRLLIQDQDGFSIRCLAKDIYNKKSIPDNLNERFNKQRDCWNKLRQSRSIFRNPIDNKKFLNADLFDTLFYGGIAHSNPKRAKLFYTVTMQGAYSSVVFGWFLNSLRLLLVTVRTMREINKELLEHLRTP